MTRSYLIKWDGGQATRSDLQSAQRLAEENNGKIFIADGKNTKSLDETEVHHFNDKNED